MIAIDLRFSPLERGGDSASLYLIVIISIDQFDEQSVKFKEALKVL